MKRNVCAEGLRIEYTLIQAARRDVMIQALEGDATRVYAPKTMRLRDIDEVVRQNAAQILAMREKLRPVPLKDGDCVRVEGVPRRISLQTGPAHVALFDERIEIYAPDPANVEAVRAQLRAFLAELALNRIRRRIDYYLPRTGGQVNRVAVRAQRARWGSCSAKHNLNFNWRLIMAPPKCLDYVVIHELCHLKEFNHSPRFWQLVRAQMGDYEIWKEYLKRNGAGLTF